MMILQVKVLVLVGLFCSLAECREKRYYSNNYYEDSEFIERFEKLEESEHKWQLKYLDSMERLFWNQQKVADELIAEEAADTSSYALKRMSALYAEIVSAGYAIGRDSINRAKSVLERQISSTNKKLPEDVRLDESEAELFELLTELRASIDIHYATNWQWKLMHKLVEHYVDATSRPELKSLAVEIYRERRDSSNLVSKMTKSFERYNSNEAKTREILAHFDKVMSKVGGCSNCMSELYKFDGKFPENGPKFNQQIDLVKLLDTYVNPKLRVSISESSKSVEGKLEEPSKSEVESVKLDDIEKLEDEILSSKFGSY